jgi:phosphotransacetylase
MPDSIPADHNKVTRHLIEQLQRHPKRVVFTEGEDIRVIQAAARLVALEAVAPILLGDVARIRALAAEHGVPLNFVRVINPKTSSDLPLFVKRAENMARYRASGQIDSEETLVRPHYFGAMMVQYGHADALVGGLSAEFVGLAGFDGYVEYDAFGYGGDLALETGPQLGHGVYASTSAYCAE